MKFQSTDDRKTWLLSIGVMSPMSPIIQTLWPTFALSIAWR